MYYIYTLEKENTIFYIGKTNNINIRLKNHKHILKENIKIEILDIVDDWRFWEKYWIWQFKSWGFKLINKNNGGGGLECLSDEIKRKISFKLKGKNKHRNPETNIKIGLSNKGLKKSPCSVQRKEKISKANKGKKYNLGKKYNVKSYKKVLQYDLEGNLIKEWDNVWSILNYYNKKKTNTSIFNCCQGKTQSAYGYKWKYKNN